MRLHVVYDRSGKIVAAVRLNSANSNHPRPVVGEGHTAAEITVPKEHAHLSFSDACQQLRVHASGPSPSLKHRSQHGAK
jgi:hypothetical protein